MIRELGRSLADAVLEQVGRASSRVQERAPLPVDLLESDDAYLAVFDAPGATGSDVQVRFSDGTVHVRVDRFREFYEGFEMRIPGRGLALDGRMSLPEGAAVDPDGATATLRQDGTLEVRVPKTDEGSIEVTTDEAETEAEVGADGTAGEADGTGSDGGDAADDERTKDGDATEEDGDATESEDGTE